MILNNTSLTALQTSRVLDTVKEIVDNLPPKALNQLLGGYADDVDRMILEMASQTEYALNLGKALDSEMLDYVDRVKASMDETLKIQSWSYFNTTVLSNFRMNWRNLEVNNLVQLFPWSGYLMARGSGKCLKINTLVVMYDGSLKKIQDIQVGDLVMGPDSKPRRVLELHRGRAPMYRVDQVRGESYTVCKGHLLELDYQVKGSGYYKNRQFFGEYIWKKIFLPVEEVLKDKRYLRNKYRGFRTGWELSEKELPIEPYFLGLWLGDGSKINTSVLKPDLEIKEYLSQYAERLGEDYFVKEVSPCGYKISSKKSRYNILRRNLKEIGVFGNKHIPDIYMRSSYQQRLDLFAGLLDADGSYYPLKNNQGNTFSFYSVDENFVLQVQQLAWSLGFRVFKREMPLKEKYINEKKVNGQLCFRLNISGDLYTIPTRIKRKQAQKTKGKNNSYHSSIKITELKEDDYYGFACDGDHRFLLADGTVTHNSYMFCWAFILWRLYSYVRPTFYRPNTIDNQNRKETALITNTMTLAKTHVNKIIEELQTNEILTEKLNPNNKAKIGETAIETETGAILHVRGKDGFIRGLHVGAALVDDLPDESSLYSDEQREKLKEVFRGTITPIVEPYGYLIVSGTPYSTAPNELYNIIKADNRFAVFEYPAVFPDGRPLAPDRYTFEDLLMKKSELGSMVFSREYLVVPIADSSTIFPYDFLMRSTVGMENINFAESVDSYPFKMKKVVVGIDFATSGNIGADYTVFTCWGIDYQDNFHLINIWRKQGASHNEQIDKIVLWDRLYRPNTVICEANGFQGILSDMARQRGLRNVEKFTTTEGNKKDLHTGWPSLSALFERGQIRMPYKTGETRDLVEIIFSEFSSITFRSDKGKLEAVGAHDDIVSSSFMSVNKLREESKVQFKVDYI